MVDCISILGGTGSIGVQALDVAERLGVRVTALSGGRNVPLAEAQARRYNPAIYAMADITAAADLRVRLADTPVKVYAGANGLDAVAAAPGAQTVISAIVGVAGLAPTMTAIEAKKNIALANKETLVCAGPLFLAEAAKNGATVLPIDSEHSAIHQCLAGAGENRPRKLILTCSGGPFRGYSREQLEKVTFADTQKHPTWNMGWKITLDSATLFNKGLELLEAVALFGVGPGQVEVVVHPQSVVHSAVEFADGSVIAQLGWPDMRLPIQYALTWPERLECPLIKPFSLLEAGPLIFEKPDETAFPCLALGRQAAEMGGVAGAVYNAAGEASAELFRQGKIGFLQIPDMVEQALARTPKCELTMGNILRADEEARQKIKAEVT